MPIPAAQLKTAEIVVSGSAAAKGSSTVRTVTIFHFRRTAFVNDPSKAAIVTAFTASDGVPLLAAMNLGWTWDHTQCRFLEDVTDNYNLVANGSSGTQTGDRFPPHVAIYMDLATGLRGRRYKGSKHLSPISESDTSAATADILNAGALGRFNDIGTAILAGFTTPEPNAWVPVVVSKKYADIIAVPAVFPSADVIAVNVNQRLGRMKRRQVLSVY